MSFYKRYAKGRRPIGEMNDLETRFANYLEELKRDGEVLWWAYEPVKLRLAANTTYTPDFLLMTKDCELQVWETKGVWTPAARIKIKMAAEKFPFRFFGVQWKRKQWVIEEFVNDREL